MELAHPKAFLITLPPPHSQVTISYGTLRPDEAAIYYGFVPRGGSEGATTVSDGSVRSALCAVDHSEYDPQMRPGKNAWPQFTGESSCLTPFTHSRLIIASCV